MGAHTVHVRSERAPSSGRAFAPRSPVPRAPRGPPGCPADRRFRQPFSRELRWSCKCRVALQPDKVLQPADVAVDEDTLGYICQGPLLSVCGITAEDVRGSAALWLHLGDICIRDLGFPPRDQLSDGQRARIFHYYLPVFFWCHAQLAAHREARSDGGAPLVIGMQAPQGCGKTTLVQQLEKLFRHEGYNAVQVSQDDFYLTYEAQRATAQANPGNALLEMRGNAGTHDLELGARTLAALREARSADTEIPIPRYDKSQHQHADYVRQYMAPVRQGRGDRAERAAWPVVRGPVDVVLFEGWSLGFTPVEEAAAAAVSPDLLQINQLLPAYVDQWDSLVDTWVVVRVSDVQHVYEWRLQAEHAMRDAGKPGMTDEQVADFVDRYMPAYRAYLPAMYSGGPSTARPGRLLVLQIGGDRALAPDQPQPVK